MPPELAAGIARVKGAKQQGARTGKWLTLEQAERLISVPNPATAKGRRDRALLAVLIGCGLRRKEAAALTVEHIQLREARWVIVDLVNKAGRITGDRMTAQSIFEAVRIYGAKIGVPELAPHDLRRTFAKLAHKGRAAPEQIQLSLGHASITTTEAYLGVRQDLTDAPCDHLGLKVEVSP